MYNVPFLEKTGLFTSIDIRFAGFMAALADTDDPALTLAAALASRNIRNGDVCVDLEACAGGKYQPESDQPNVVQCPTLKKWQDSLFKSNIVGSAGDFKPLILDEQNRLYLYRYWEYEQKLSDALLERTSQPLPEIADAVFRESLERLFPEEDKEETNWQKIAAVVAALKRLCIISGGPGTGKTFAVARILAFLLEQHQHNSTEALKIFLAAPTGKAASRLTESIASARESLVCSEAVKTAIPGNSLTIHRLLKSKGYSSRFHYNVENKLPADVVVVDEASMVDLPLMSKLVQALSSETRLILLGDGDQLASVEAGSVLGDICGEQRTNRFSSKFRNHIKLVAHITTRPDLELTPEIIPEVTPEIKTDKPGLHDCRVYFTKSFRFDDQSGIPRLSNVVNKGRAEEVIDLLRKGNYGDITWLPINKSGSIAPLIEKMIVLHYGELTSEKDPARALDLMNQFKILCALNHGPYGVSGINQLAADMLKNSHGKGYGSVGRQATWYHGRPILIRKNDYQLELFNGDMGIVLPDPDNQGNLSVFFSRNNKEIRSIAPYKLPEHETAYAMTIHKSQGSEFDEVLMVLPEKDTPILTRELIYTGITRARQNLSILSTESAIRLAVSRRIDRTSGLRDKLAVQG